MRQGAVFRMLTAKEPNQSSQPGDGRVREELPVLDGVVVQVIDNSAGVLFGMGNSRNIFRGQRIAAVGKRRVLEVDNVVA